MGKKVKRWFVLSVLLQLAASDHRLTFLPIVLSVLLQLTASDHRLTFFKRWSEAAS
jgi:hypothetical protein